MPRIASLKLMILGGLIALLALPWGMAPAMGNEPIPILPRAAERSGDDFMERGTEEFSVTPLSRDLVSVRLLSRAETPEKALEQARRRAVLASAGRVMMDDYLIRADALMTRYLENYADNFINGIEELSREFGAGEVSLDCRVFVNFTRLQRDLEEKRFLYRPAYKPMFVIFMEEELDGTGIDQEVARGILQSKLAENDLKNYLGIVDTPPTTVNVVRDGILGDAIVTAERRNVEVLISGTTRTRQIEGLETRRVYYDTFYFYESEMDVTVVRVDTGEELFTLTAKGAAAARDRAEAIRMAIERAASEIARDTRERHRSDWSNVVRNTANYEILLTGADEELIRVIRLHLERLSGSTQIHLKKKFDRTAVLSVVTDVNREEVLERIRACPYPTLTVVQEVGGRRFEVRISG